MPQVLILDIICYYSYDEAVEQLEITMKELQDIFVDKKQVRPVTGIM